MAGAASPIIPRSRSDRDLLPTAPLGPLPAFLAQHFLAEPDLRGSNLDELVRLDVLERDFQGDLTGWLEQDVTVRSRGPHVGELLLLAGIDAHVVGSGILGHDHAFVDVVSGSDEHRTALL